MSEVGKIHSIQTLGTLDGPGVRFVIFTSGCNLRCGCCHNPDTWDMSGGKEYTARELVERAERYRSYFGKDGGVTVSGGEPLLQPQFVTELFTLCHRSGVNTCLDTSGSILNEKIKELISVCDRVLLDIKYTDDEKYRKYVGCSLNAPLEFLCYLEAQGIKTTLRQVVIPGLNDDAENYERLSDIIVKHKCIDSAELLPFKKICRTKYDQMGIPFAFDAYPIPDHASVKKAEKLLRDVLFSRQP